MLFKEEVYRSGSQRDIRDVVEVLRANDIEIFPQTIDTGDSIHRITTINVKAKDKDQALYVLRGGN